MNYITAREAGALWNISERRARELCRIGHIPGSLRKGNRWLIPSTAEKPVDGRTKDGRTIAREHYRFPVLVYSPVLAHPDELTPAERELLEAQLLCLRGRYADSIAILRRLMADKRPTHLSAGIFYTVCYNTMMLGMPGERSMALNELKRLGDTQGPHRADYRLLYNTAIRFSPGHSRQAMLYTMEDVRGLSTEALPLAIYAGSLQRAMEIAGGRTPDPVHEELLCSYMEQVNIAPIAYHLHICLIIMYQSVGRTKDAIYHIERALEIGIKGRYTGLLAQYYYYVGSNGQRRLKAADSVLYEDVKSLCRNMMRVSEVGLEFNILNGVPEAYEGDQFVYISLISCGQTNAGIAKILNKTIQQVEDDIKNLCRQYGLSSRSELKKRFETGLKIIEEAPSP